MVFLSGPVSLSLWQPNSILHLWAGTTRASTQAHPSMVVSGQPHMSRGSSEFPKREFQEAQRNTSVTPEHHLCTFCGESRSQKLAEIEGKENCTFSLSGRGHKAEAAIFNFTHMFKTCKIAQIQESKGNTNVLLLITLLAS